MSLIEKITDEIKTAMKAREQLKLEALRSIKKELLEAQTSAKSGGKVSEDEELKILQKMVKQRKDSATIYSAQGRADLYDKEIAEADIIAGFLPAQMSPEEMEAELKNIIQEMGADSMKDMGKVMGVASKKLAGKADGKDISNTVKRLLSEG
ncbi:GatB/YqeY domain-containing protein [Marinilabilia rubra]|uniref:Glutamyl-tRNA amidotransferase n=1 Tax=Marinilabilia rubra TaxID=2162893 RepID=A0A2U2BEB3_9BACT|nr:GatB/YqeY domain-containing protein [Marinilabilia rubra]PWE01416.1 glutamyl-tRNA amidotransferase [Marinilabilia rubra]